MKKQNRTLKPHERHELIAKHLRLADSLTISEIAERLRVADHLEVSKKTISRDLAEMSSKAAFGLTEEEAFPRRYKLLDRHGRKNLQIHLEAEHLQVISMGLTGLKAFNSLKSIALKTEKAITDSLPDDLKGAMAHENHSWMLQWPQSGKRKEHSSAAIETILKAMRMNAAVSGIYKAAEVGRERNLAPLKVELSGSGLSILARDLDAQDQPIKRFVPSRFESLRVVESHREPETTAKELEPFQSTFGGFGGPDQIPELITLIVGKNVGEHLREVEYHPTQRIKPRPDGKFEVTLKVAIGWPIVRVIASFGGNIDDISPTHLKVRVYEIWNGGQRAMKRGA